MKLCYQVSTPDVRRSPGVTAYQSDLETAFRRLSEVGYDGAELMVCNPAQVDRKKIESLARQHRLCIPMICTGEVFGQDQLFFSSPDRKIREEAISRVKDAVDLAACFDAQVNIGRVRGGMLWGQPPEECRKRILDAFWELSDYARPKGVTIALEPVNTLALNYINSTKEGLDMVRQVGRDNFRLMLDTAHMFLEDKDIPESIAESKGQVTYVHLCDSNRKYPGHCKIDFSMIIGELKKTGYDGVVSVEVFQMPDQDTALQKSYDYLKPLL